jgi:ketosteroid isomerase-like protein
MKLPTVVERYIEAYNAMDVDAMLACLTSDVHFRNISAGETNAETNGKSEFAELARMGATAFSSRRQTVTHCINVAERTMAEVEFEAVVAADLPNGWKTGQKLSFAGASYFEIRDGEIARIIDES